MKSLKLVALLSTLLLGLGETSAYAQNYNGGSQNYNGGYSSNNGGDPDTNGGYHRSQRFRVACIWNETDTTLNYSARINNGRWETYSLSPGQWRGHYIEHPNGSSSMLIRFDAAMSEQVRYREYNINMYSSYSNECSEISQKNAFRYSRSHRRIDLFTQAGERIYRFGE
jgi:hypothetical protein